MKLAYPGAVPDDVLNEIKRDKIEQEEKEERSCLTRCLPTVREPERRNFTVKIFILLLIQLGFTFGYVLLANLWEPLR